MTWQRLGGKVHAGCIHHAVIGPVQVHGSAPDIAGQDIANPLAMVLSAAMMCRYGLNLPKVSLPTALQGRLFVPELFLGACCPISCPVTGGGTLGKCCDCSAGERVSDSRLVFCWNAEGGLLRDGQRAAGHVEMRATSGFLGFIPSTGKAGIYGGAVCHLVGDHLRGLADMASMSHSCKRQHRLTRPVNCGLQPLMQHSCQRGQTD